MKNFSPSIYVASIGLLLVFATACNGDMEKDAQALGYEMKTVEKVYQADGTAGENKTLFRVSYPVFSDGEHAETFNSYLLSWIADSTAVNAAPNDSGNVTLEQLADEFFAEYESVQKEFSVSWPYQFDLDGSVLLNRSGLLTVDLSYYAFTGGAHGNSYTQYFVFDAVGGTRLGLDDVFVQGFEERLNKLIDSRYREMKGLTAADRLDGEKGMLFDNVVEFNGNFALTGQGVSFFYNNYEIAPYAVGSTTIELPYGDLENILKPQIRELWMKGY
jgi:hypothetical protein